MIAVMETRSDLRSRHDEHSRQAVWACRGFLIANLSRYKPALIFLSFSVDSCLILGRFDETVIEERRQCAEDLLQFSANIPALYNSKQLEDFFKVWCSFWNILYLIKWLYFLICSKARFKVFFFLLQTKCHLLLNFIIQ